MSDQQAVNRIASRVRAALALIPHLQGPKEAIEDWILNGLRDEYLNASDIMDETVELKVPRILLSLERFLTSQQGEHVDFEAIQSDDPLIQHDAGYTVTEVDTDEEDDLGDKKWWMNPPSLRGVMVKQPVETEAAKKIASVVVIPALSISKMPTAGSPPKPVKMKSAKISSAAVPPAHLEEFHNQICTNCSVRGVDCVWPQVKNKRVNKACTQCSVTKVKCEVPGQTPLRKKRRRSGPESSRPSPLAGRSTDILDRLDRLEKIVQGYQEENLEKETQSILLRVALLETRLKESRKTT